MTTPTTPPPTDMQVVRGPAKWLNESLNGVGDLYSATMIGSNFALAVGDQSTIVDWKQGSGWAVLNSPQGSVMYTSVAASSGTNIWIGASNGTVIFSDGVKPTSYVPCMPASCPGSFLGLWLTPAGLPWAVGSSHMAYRQQDQGSQYFSFLSAPGSDTQTMFAVWGASGSDVWVSSNIGILHHYDGSAFKEYVMPSGSTVRGLWGRRTSDVWAVGREGLVLHWSGPGNDWVQVSVPQVVGVTLNGVTGNNSGEVWIVGDSGTILYYDGAAWQRQDSTVTYNLYSVTMGLNDTTPIAVGAKGTALRMVYGSNT